MTGTRKNTALLVAATLLLMAAPAAGQEEAETDGATTAGSIEVSGVDYAFVGLPTSVPAGTELTFRNDGTEFHEMAVVKINDETTPLEELMAMPEEETEAITEFVGFLSTMPGTLAEGSVSLTAPGRYVVLCFIPQGSDPAVFEETGFDPTIIDENTDPSTLPPEVQELLTEIESNPPHMALGMVQEFTVGEAGSDVGPMPETASDDTASQDEGSSSE